MLDEPRFGHRAYVRNQGEYVDDLALGIREIERTYPGKPIFLQGESLGAGVALLASLCADFPIQGLILNAPPVYVNFQIFSSPIPDWLATYMLKMVGMMGRIPKCRIAHYMTRAKKKSGPILSPGWRSV